MVTVRDPVCGMDVDSETALSAKIGDRTYYFCSQQCLDVYTAAERELNRITSRRSALAEAQARLNSSLAEADTGRAAALHRQAFLFPPMICWKATRPWSRATTP